MQVKFSASLIALAAALVSSALGLHCSIYTGDRAFINKIEFTSQGDLPAPLEKGDTSSRATITIAPKPMENQQASFVMEHLGFQCDQGSNQASICNAYKHPTKPNCARSYYGADKFNQLVSANVDMNRPGKTVNFSATLEQGFWYIHAKKTCAKKYYKAPELEMRQVLLTSEVPHVWSEMTIRLSEPYLALAKGWQCQYDKKLEPRQYHFSTNDEGLTWTITNIRFETK